MIGWVRDIYRVGLEEIGWVKGVGLEEIGWVQRGGSGGDRVGPKGWVRKGGSGVRTHPFGPTLCEILPYYGDLCIFNRVGPTGWV